MNTIIFGVFQRCSVRLATNERKEIIQESWSCPFNKDFTIFIIFIFFAVPAGAVAYKANFIQKVIIEA